jgi:hypothetical protein
VPPIEVLFLLPAASPIPIAVEPLIILKAPAFCPGLKSTPERLKLTKILLVLSFGVIAALKPVMSVKVEPAAAWFGSCYG